MGCKTVRNFFFHRQWRLLKGNFALSNETCPVLYECVANTSLFTTYAVRELLTIGSVSKPVYKALNRRGQFILPNPALVGSLSRLPKETSGTPDGNCRRSKVSTEKKAARDRALARNRRSFAKSFRCAAYGSIVEFVRQFGLVMR